MINAFRDGWFSFDFVFVGVLGIELGILQPLYYFGLIEMTSGSSTLFRLFRIGRILRFFHVFRGFRNLQVVLKGSVIGMHSAMSIWTLLGLLTFTFSLALTAS